MDGKRVGLGDSARIYIPSAGQQKPCITVDGTTDKTGTSGEREEKKKKLLILAEFANNSLVHQKAVTENL